MFTKERKDKLLVYRADYTYLLEEQSVSVEKQFCDEGLSSVHDVIVDLSNVQMISSRFCNWLIIIEQMVERKGGKLVLCSITPHVLEILTHLHLTSIITVADNVCAARQLLSDNGQPASTA